jgi:ABC-type glycerol-3-phosphate transport system substrate-binding protein
LAVTSRDATRASAATALIKWLLAPDTAGAWTRAANLLPARRSAFDHWYPPDRNTAFFRRELERAMLPPSAQIAQAIGPALQKAVADVLRGQVQPSDAAMTAAASVSRSAR